MADNIDKYGVAFCGLMGVIAILGLIAFIILSTGWAGIAIIAALAAGTYAMKRFWVDRWW
jgi:hypothetical protein